MKPPEKTPKTHIQILILYRRILVENSRFHHHLPVILLSWLRFLITFTYLDC